MTAPEQRVISRTTILILSGSVLLNAGLAAGVLLRPGRPTGAVTRTVTKTAETLAPLEGHGVLGEPITITFPDSRPTLVYVMSPECAWCRRNEANFTAIARSQGEKYRIALVSLIGRGFSEYYESHAQAWEGSGIVPIVAEIGNGPGKLRVSGTPTLLVVSAAGVVERIWSGAIGESRAEVEKFFGITLPGIDR